MPTLRSARLEDLSPDARRVLERIARSHGTTPAELSPIWRTQAHWPDLVEANARQEMEAFKRVGRLSTLTKEAMHVAVSMSNACEYCISRHVAAILRLGVSEQGVTEIMAVAEHMGSVIVVADGLLLQWAGPEEAGVSGLLEPSHDKQAGGSETMAEIAEWLSAPTGSEVASFWRILARKPRVLDAVWNKHRVVLGHGEFDADTKVVLALAVAMARRSGYWIRYMAERGRQLGIVDDDVILETVAAVMHMTSFNTIAHAMMLEAPQLDMHAEGPGSAQD